MDTEAAWVLLNKREHWQKRCRIIGWHHRDHLDWAADALRHYAQGNVTHELEADLEAHAYLLVEGLRSPDIDWLELAERFRAAGHE